MLVLLRNYYLQYTCSIYANTSAWLLLLFLFRCWSGSKCCLFKPLNLIVFPFFSITLDFMNIISKCSICACQNEYDDGMRMWFWLFLFLSQSFQIHGLHKPICCIHFKNRTMSQFLGRFSFFRKAKAIQNKIVSA